MSLDCGFASRILLTSIVEHETERVDELSKRLQVPLSVKNFVQSHTPFQQLVHGSDGIEGLQDKVVLVTGGHGGKCRTVAEKYVLFPKFSDT